MTATEESGTTSAITSSQQMKDCSEVPKQMEGVENVLVDKLNKEKPTKKTASATGSGTSSSSSSLACGSRDGEENSGHNANMNCSKGGGSKHEKIKSKKDKKKKTSKKGTTASGPVVPVHSKRSGKLRRKLARRTFYDGITTYVVDQGRVIVASPAQQDPNSHHHYRHYPYHPHPSGALATLDGAVDNKESCSNNSAIVATVTERSGKGQRHEQAVQKIFKYHGYDVLLTYNPDSNGHSSCPTSNKQQQQQTSLSPYRTLQKAKVNPGNTLVWEWIDQYADTYLHATQEERTSIASRLVRAIQKGRWTKYNKSGHRFITQSQQQPSGRFLEQDNDGYYRLVSSSDALDAVCRGLHEKAFSGIPPGQQKEEYRPPNGLGTKKGLGPDKSSSAVVTPKSPKSATKSTASTVSSNKRKQSPMDDLMDTRIPKKAATTSSTYANGVSALQALDAIQIDDKPGPPRTEEQTGAIIRAVHCHDVLCGKGQNVSYHPGNLFFRKLVWQFKEVYEACSKSQKRHVAIKVIEHIRCRNPPGRFLEAYHHAKYPCYVDAPENKVFEKTCQALREKKWRSQALVEQLLERPGFNASAGAKYPSASTLLTEIDSNSSSPEQGNDGASGIGTPKADVAPAVATVMEPQKLDDIKAGSKISIYWALDRVYYGSTVLQRDNDKVLVEYHTDGVKEWISLSQHEIIIDEI